MRKLYEKFTFLSVWHSQSAFSVFTDEALEFRSVIDDMFWWSREFVCVCVCMANTMNLIAVFSLCVLVQQQNENGFFGSFRFGFKFFFFIRSASNAFFLFLFKVNFSRVAQFDCGCCFFVLGGCLAAGDAAAAAVLLLLQLSMAVHNLSVSMTIDFHIREQKKKTLFNPKSRQIVNAVACLTFCAAR